MKDKGQVSYTISHRFNHLFDFEIHRMFVTQMCSHDLVH